VGPRDFPGVLEKQKFVAAAGTEQI